MSDETEPTPQPWTRYFRTSVEIYESVRAQMDEMYGHEKRATGSAGIEVVTSTCLTPASALVQREGLVVVALNYVLTWPEVAATIAMLIEVEAVEEISEEEFLEHNHIEQEP
jgi:hypothetical protein